MIELYIYNFGRDRNRSKLKRGKIEKDDSSLMWLAKEKHQGVLFFGEHLPGRRHQPARKTDLADF